MPTYYAPQTLDLKYIWRGLRSRPRNVQYFGHVLKFIVHRQLKKNFVRLVKLVFFGLINKETMYKRQELVISRSTVHISRVSKALCTHTYLLSSDLMAIIGTHAHVDVDRRTWNISISIWLNLIYKVFVLLRSAYFASHSDFSLLVPFTTSYIREVNKYFHYD